MSKRHTVGIAAPEHRYEKVRLNEDIKLKTGVLTLLKQDYYHSKLVFTSSSSPSCCGDGNMVNDTKPLIRQINVPRLPDLFGAPLSGPTHNSPKSIFDGSSTATLPGSVISLGISGPTIVVSSASETTEDSGSSFKSTSHKMKISNLILRDFDGSSDADDEKGPSDFDTRGGSDTDWGHGEIDPKIAYRDHDDQGLSTKVGRLRLGKRGRERSRDIEANNELGEAETNKSKTVSHMPRAEDSEQLPLKRCRKFAG